MVRRRNLSGTKFGGISFGNMWQFAFDRWQSLGIRQPGLLPIYIDKGHNFLGLIRYSKKVAMRKQIDVTSFAVG